jgi:hypothetical protein
MRLAPRKRPRALLAALREVRRRVPASVPLRAVVAGEGPERGALERYRLQHDLDWVSLPGRLDAAALRELYTAADVYVAPAVLEAFGIAALEARAAGLPVVARTAPAWWSSSRTASTVCWPLRRRAHRRPHPARRRSRAPRADRHPQSRRAAGGDLGRGRRPHPDLLRRAISLVGATTS